MTINSDIKESIEKNLPSLVAKELKEYIEQAEKDKSTIKSLCGTNEKLLSDLSKLQMNWTQVEANKKISEDLSRRRQEVERLEAALNLKAQAVLIHDEFNKRHVGEMKELVALVFKNNQYKYQEDGQRPVPYNPNGTSYTGAPFNKTVTQEG